MDTTFLGLLLLGAPPSALLQFVCCLFKPRALKFVPYGLLVGLWIAAGPTSGFDSLRFTMTLLTVPILIGTAVGWLLYALLLAIRRCDSEDNKKDRKEL